MRFSLPSIIVTITSSKPWNTQNGSKSTNHRSQTMTFWICVSKVLFPKRSAKMIGGSEKRKCQLAFELQSSRVFEKRSKNIQILTGVSYWQTSVLWTPLFCFSLLLHVVANKLRHAFCAKLLSENTLAP